MMNLAAAQMSADHQRALQRQAGIRRAAREAGGHRSWSDSGGRGRSVRVARLLRAIALSILIITALSLLGPVAAWATASTGTFAADRVPGVQISVDCAAGRGHVLVGNADMAGSTVEVTIDGERQPELQVDSSGELQHSYPLTPGQPHRLTIVYDFVPGGTPWEENQVLSVSCLDGPLAVPPTEADAAPSGSIVEPAQTWRMRSRLHAVLAA